MRITVYVSPKLEQLAKNLGVTVKELVEMGITIIEDFGKRSEDDYLAYYNEKTHAVEKLNVRIMKKPPPKLTLVVNKPDDE